jgi:hypothetical protein
MASVKESKSKIVNTLDHVIANLRADESVHDMEWQAVMIAREVLASSSAFQLAKAIAKVAPKIE